MPSARTGRPNPAADALVEPPAGARPVAACTNHRAGITAGSIGRRCQVLAARTIRFSGVLLLSAVLLAGCASGSAEDARRAEERQADRGVLLPQQQATANAARFAPGTATALPTLPPMPVLESLVLTLNVDGTGAPQGAYGGIPSDAGRVYAAALLNDLQPGQQVTATLRLPDDTVLLSSAFDVTAPADRAWVALPLDMNGTLAAGDYALWLAVDDRSLNSLVVQVTGYGTAPRQLTGVTSPGRSSSEEGGVNDPSQDVPSGGPTIEPISGGG